MGREENREKRREVPIIPKVEGHAGKVTSIK